MARHREQGQELCERHQLTDNDRSATSCPAERLERFHVCEGQRIAGCCTPCGRERASEARGSGALAWLDLRRQAQRRTSIVAAPIPRCDGLASRLSTLSRSPAAVRLGRARAEPLRLRGFRPREH
jgi:hypothetical protein